MSSKEYNKQYYEDHKARILEKQSIYREENRDLILERHKKESKEYYERNKDTIRERARAAYQDNKEKHRQRYQKNREVKRNGDLKRKFGIYLEDYHKLLDAQGGVCGICGSPPGVASLAVDHDHASGTVRGLLCDHCNHGLGKFRDSKELLVKAIEWLDKKATELRDQ